MSEFLGCVEREWRPRCPVCKGSSNVALTELAYIWTECPCDRYGSGGHLYEQPFHQACFVSRFLSDAAGSLPAPAAVAPDEGDTSSAADNKVRVVA